MARVADDLWDRIPIPSYQWPGRIGSLSDKFHERRRAFLDSLIASPKDAAPWLVYADWLDERGDPRGEYLRLVHDLARSPTTSSGDG